MAQGFALALALVASGWVLLASGCSYDSMRAARGPSGREVATFVADFEQAIALRDARSALRCFLPSATVVLIEDGATGGARYTAGEWLASLSAGPGALRRSREVRSIERDAAGARTLVRSRLLETRAAGGAVRETRSEEWMWIVWSDGVMRIGALGVEIEGETLIEPL